MSEDINEFRNKIKKNLEILINNNKLVEAREALEEYENIVKDDVDVYSIKGTIEIMEGNIEEAIEILKKGLYRFGENFDILFNLGYINENRLDMNQAIEYYKRAMRVSSNPNMIDMIYEILKKLNVDETIDSILNNFNKEDSKKLKVTFFPYKISMWDSLKSVYEAACKDDNCIVNVVPIPYYEIANDKLIENYEGDRFPKEVSITHYSEYNMEYEKPDIVFLHNIYDQYNTITRVYERYFTKNIKKYAEMVVYVPYHIPSLFYPFGRHATYTMPSVKYVDKIILMNDYIKEVAINDNIPNSKLISLGSPKIDFLVSNITKEKIYPDEWKDRLEGKTVYLLETGCMYFINNTFAKIEEVINILSITNINKETAIIWRPHPLTKTALGRYSPDLLGFYNNLTENNIKGVSRLYNNVILDETDNYLNAINSSDALISASSSILGAYLLTEKKIIFLGKEIPKPSLVPDDIFYYFYDEKESWYELINKINKGYDPLLNNRKGIAEKVFKNLSGNVGQEIYEIFRDLFMNR